MQSKEWSAPLLIKQGECEEENWSLFYQQLMGSDGSSNVAQIKTTWRVIPMKHSFTTREYESTLIQGTFREFSQWVDGTIATDIGHHQTSRHCTEYQSFGCLPSFKSKLVAVYADYKYFHELFSTDEHQTNPELICDQQALWLVPPTTCSSSTQTPRKILDWGLLRHSGGHDVDSDDDREEEGNNCNIPSEMGPEASTFWLGCRGAHTPLHYDSYGCNVVLQLHGRKTWLFWEPSEYNKQSLRPQRIPYEESSVYSEYDPRPSHLQCLNDHIESHNMTVSEGSDRNVIPPDVTIVMEAGNVLLVPKHWWHFVHTESDTALSMNMWIPSTDNSNNEKSCEIRQLDAYDSATEAVGRLLFGSMKRSVDSMQWGHSLDVGEEEEVVAGRGWLNNPSANVVKRRDDEGQFEDRKGTRGRMTKDEGCHCDNDIRDDDSVVSTECGDDPPITDMDVNLDLLVAALHRLGYDHEKPQNGHIWNESKKRRFFLQRVTSALLHPDALSACVDRLLQPQPGNSSV